MGIKRNNDMITVNWDALLAQFCKSSGLVAVLFDHKDRVLSQTDAGNQYSERITSLIKENGMRVLQPILSEFSQSDEAAIRTYESLGFALVPILDADKKLIFKILIGFVPTHFLDPVETDQLARFYGVEYNELWHCVRGQQPISPSLLEAQAGFLDYAANSYYAEAEAKLQQKKLAYKRQLISDGVLKITKCESLNELSNVIFNSVSKVSPCKSAMIKVFTEGNESDLWAESQMNSSAET